VRKCLRCESEMVEDLVIMVADHGYGVDVRKGLFRGSFGELKCAVCPQCGYTESYLDYLPGLKKLAEEKK